MKIGSFSDSVFVVLFYGLDVMLVFMLLIKFRLGHMLSMLLRLDILYGALNMMVGSGLLVFSNRIVSFVALLILMLVDELLWNQMTFFFKYEGVMRFFMNWHRMNLPMSSRISRQIRLDPLLTNLTLSIIMILLKMVFIRCQFIMQTSKCSMEIVFILRLRLERSHTGSPISILINLMWTVGSLRIIAIIAIPKF